MIALLCTVVQVVRAQASWDEVYAMTGTTPADWAQLSAGSSTGKTIGTAGSTTYYYADANLAFSNSTAGGSGLTILLRAAQQQAGAAVQAVRVRAFYMTAHLTIVQPAAAVAAVPEALVAQPAISAPAVLAAAEEVVPQEALHGKIVRMNSIK